LSQSVLHVLVNKLIIGSSSSSTMQAAQSGWPAAVAAAASSAPSAATTSVTMETRDNYSEGNGRAIMKVEEDDIDEEEADDPQQRRDQDPDDDAEGVWSQDIEQSFQEALAMYPPCGRRKIILQEEGRMYGRNELIARYIRLRTGKTRTRKQVSSHIQVLARRRTKEVQSNIRDPATKERAMQTLSQLSSAQIVSAGLAPASTRGQQQQQQHQPEPASTTVVSESLEPDSPVSIAGPRLRLRELIAFVEAPALADPADSSQQQQQQRRVCPDRRHLFASLTAASADAAPPPLECVDVSQIADKFPERRGGLRDFLESGPDGAAYLVKFWADINTPIPDEAGAFYGFGTTYESTERLTLSCSTKVCSFGRQVVEKVEKHIGPRLESGRYVYQSDRSPMCEYMVNFITKLRQLPEKYMMNTVLENFTILQVINCESSGDSLLCIAYVFEVSSGAAQHHVYRLSRG
ncbi:hypothetical protein BOX15_Mlig016564g1, partial [Macrostomum lignano]